MTSSSELPSEGANGNGHAGRYYGQGIPYLPLASYPGKLIAIEGTDGVGRSTQIRGLKPWLEELGHAVLDTGMARSALATWLISTQKAISG